MSSKNHDTTVSPVHVADLNAGITSEVQESEPQHEADEVKPDEVPDGGTTAWLQVLGSFCLFWNTW